MKLTAHVPRDLINRIIELNKSKKWTLTEYRRGILLDQLSIEFGDKKMKYIDFDRTFATETTNDNDYSYIIKFK